MSVGERIKFFRNLRGMTQKYLGMKIGFSERTADIRMAQYESGTRTPKAELTAAMAHELGVSSEAIDIPILESEYGFMHTLFVMEDLYGLKVDKVDGEVCLRFERRTEFPKNTSALDRLDGWQKEYAKLKAGEITKEEYDKWRYTYPEVEAGRTRDALDELRKQRSLEHND